MRVRLILLLSLLSSSLFVCAESGSPFYLGQSLAEIEERNDLLPKPFDTSGLQPELQELLESYYRSLGGPEVWQDVISLLIEGEVGFVDGDSLHFSHYRMKPDLSKSVIRLPNGFEIIQCFDGNVSWEWLTFSSYESNVMLPEQSVEFVRDACFGSHLVFPQLADKKLIYHGAEMIDGLLLHRIEVILPNGQKIKYGLNSSGYLIEEETRVNKGERIRRLVFSGFKRISGMTMPYEGKIYYDDELVQTVRITSIHINKGVYSWMFQM